MEQLRNDADYQVDLRDGFDLDVAIVGARASECYTGRTYNTSSTRNWSANSASTPTASTQKACCAASVSPPRRPP